MNRYNAIISVVGIVCVLAVFFVVNCYTPLLSDDYVMNVGADISAILHSVKNMYFTWSGRWFALFMQFVFCGAISSKMAFNIVNSFVFALFIYIMSCAATRERTIAPP